MPSKSKSTKTAAEPDEGSAAAAVSEESTIDLMDALAVGTPGLPPVAATLRGIDFRIRRYYTPETIWEWSDLQRRDVADLKPTEVSALNRQLMSIVIVDEDKIDDLLAVIGDRSIAEARRIYAYINQVAGLTDKWGNPLAL
ncbi:MAG: hypothetical protein QM662_13815 [Gordonia sp. (in: high G+C Gram-positive bacteria)]